MATLAGKRALVTGASRGIGAAIALALADQGADVAITYERSADRAAEVVAKIQALGRRAVAIAANSADATAVKRSVEEAVTALGGLDILVNNAGIALPGSIEEQSFADWRRTMAVNLDAVFLGTRAAVRHMKARGGAIVNLSSIEGIVGNPHVPAYNASKGGVRLLTKSAALHCARAGYPVRINSLHPGYVATPMVIGALPFVPDDFAEKARERTPMGRFGEAAEIARAVVFLASEDASYMTGAELVVDGGYTA